MSSSPQKKRLFVGGLFPEVSQKDLQDRFSHFGEVESVELKEKHSQTGGHTKTFAYLDMSISDTNLKKCFAVLNKCKWKGSTLNLEIAKESFIKRLEEERESGLEVKKEEKKKTAIVKPFEKAPDVQNFHMKGAVPGTPIPGGKNWVVGKYGRVLPIVHVKKNDRRKMLRVDPSKFTHNLKRIKPGEEDSDGEANTLTWEIRDKESEITKKRKGDFPKWENKHKLSKPKADFSILQARLNKIATEEKTELEVVPIGDHRPKKLKLDGNLRTDYNSDSDMELMPTSTTGKGQKIKYNFDKDYNSHSDVEVVPVGEVCQERLKVSSNIEATYNSDSDSQEETYMYTPSKVKAVNSKSEKCIANLDHNSNSDSSHSGTENESVIKTKAEKTKSVHSSRRTKSENLVLNQEDGPTSFQDTNAVISEIRKHLGAVDSGNIKEFLDKLTNKPFVVEKDSVSLGKQTKSPFSVHGKITPKKFDKIGNVEEVRCSVAEFGSSMAASVESPLSSPKRKSRATSKGKGESHSPFMEMATSKVKPKLTEFKGTKFMQSISEIPKSGGKPKVAEFKGTKFMQSSSGTPQSDGKQDQVILSVPPGKADLRIVSPDEKSDMKGVKQKKKRKHVAENVLVMDSESDDDTDSVSSADTDEIISRTHKAPGPAASKSRVSAFNRLMDEYSSGLSDHIDSSSLARSITHQVESTDSEEDSDFELFAKKELVKIESQQKERRDQNLTPKKLRTEKLLHSEKNCFNSDLKSLKESSAHNSGKTDVTSKVKIPTNKSNSENVTNNQKTLGGANQGKLDSPIGKVTHEGSSRDKVTNKNIGHESTVVEMDENSKLTYQKKGNSSLANQLAGEEKQKTGDQKRLQALRQREQEHKAQKTAIQKALANVDKGTSPNKRITFESSSEDEDNLKDTDVHTRSQSFMSKPSESSSDSSSSSSSDDDDDDEEEDDDESSSSNDSDSNYEKSNGKKMDLQDSSFDGSVTKTSVSDTSRRERDKGRQAPTLFDASSEENSSDEERRDQDMFRHRREFEGSAGKKLMDLQSKFGNDSRFRLDERFVESDDEEPVEDADEANLKEEQDTEDEKLRSLRILQTVVGGKVKINLDKEEKKKKTFKDVSALHFDPTQEDHAHLELKTTTDTKSESSSAKKMKKGQVIVEESQEAEVEVPEVTKERFYEVSTSLKDIFGKKTEEEEEKTEETQPFSLLATFGTAESMEEDSAQDQTVSLPKPTNPFSSWQNNDGAQSSDEAISDDERLDSHIETSEINASRKNVVVFPAHRQTFFFLEGDPRLQEGLKFYRTEEMETVREKWTEQRPELVDAYRSKHKKMRRKQRLSQQSKHGRRR